MEQEHKRAFDIVPFDTFREHLGPNHENVPGVEYILEDGRLLRFCAEAGGHYQSADHLVDGTPDTPHLFRPIYAPDYDLQPIRCEDVGELSRFVGIQAEGVEVGFPREARVTQPGYVLKNGTVLLESERDAQGLYRAGAGMDGMYLRVPGLYAPLVLDGKVTGFLEVENPLRTAELSMEQNENMIDGVLNNLPPEPPRAKQGYTVLDSETVGQVEFVLAENPKAPQPFVTWRRNLDAGPTDFYWGHYFTQESHARLDFKQRTVEERKDLLDRKPSLRFQLREKQAEAAKQVPPPGGRDTGRER